MSDKNVERLKRLLLEGFGEGNMSVLDEVVAEDLIEHQQGMPQGREGLKNAIRTLRRSFPDLGYTVVQMVADEDKVLLHLPMPVRRVESHPYVVENNGRIALMRGPILYCIEHADNLDFDPRDVILPQGEDISFDFLSELLGGVAVLEARATAVAPDEGWEGRLYRTTRSEETTNHAKTVNITAVPYYAWANREPGPMLVWLRTVLR